MQTEPEPPTAQKCLKGKHHMFYAGSCSNCGVSKYRHKQAMVIYQRYISRRQKLRRKLKAAKTAPLG